MIESTTNVGINHPNEIWFPVKKNCTATNTANNNENILFSLDCFLMPTKIDNVGELYQYCSMYLK